MKSNLSHPILVTGSAGGRQGATGRHVAATLLAHGIPVRAFVRKIDERAQELRDLGAEVFEGDLLNLASVRRAFKGITRAYFTYPVDDGLLEATTIFATAAQEAKAELVVNNSQLNLRREVAPTFRNMQHGLSEHIFDWASVGAVHLNAPPYYENLRTLVSQSITAQDTVYLPWGSGDAVYPLTGSEDVARTASEVLMAPGLPSVKNFELIGETLTVRETIDLLSTTLGRPIRYVEISYERWIEAARDRINDHALHHLSHLWKFFRTSGMGKDDWTKTTSLPVTGRSPQSLEEFIAANSEAFAGGAKR